MPITPIDPNDFKNLDNIKLKYGKLLGDADCVALALIERYPPGSPTTDQLFDWIGNDLVPAVGTPSTGYIKEVLDRLNEADSQRLQNCSIYGPVEAVMDTVKDAFKEVSTAFNDLISNMFTGVAFDGVYEDMYDLWVLNDSTAIPDWLTNFGDPYVIKLNNVSSIIQGKIDDARSAATELSNSFLTWVGTARVVQTFETFIEELGCVGEDTPSSMWDYRSSALKENIDIVHQARTLSPEDMNIYLKNKGETLAASKKTELENILNDINPF
jgi:hypothetical protein